MSEPREPDPLVEIAERYAKEIVGRKIAETTRKALAAYKAEKRVSRRVRAMYPDGVPAEVVEATAGKLGADLVGCHLTEEGRLRGSRLGGMRQKAVAIEVYADLIPDMKRWRAEGLSLRAIADRLNDRGETTRTGAKWSQAQVWRVLDRLSEVRAPGGLDG